MKISHAIINSVSTAILGIGMLAQANAFAAPINVNDLLVSDLSNGKLFEYTRTGNVVQTFSTPDFERGFHDLRDIVQGNDGRIHMFNGTFTPAMTTLDPVTGTYTNLTTPGWSTVNNISYGGIAVKGKQVFVTDMMTYNGGESAGIVSFNLNNGKATRFANNHEYSDLNLGGDGLLYATNGYGIDVYNPNSFTFLHSVQLQSYQDIRGLAVDQAGKIYVASWDGKVSKFNALGKQEGNSLNLGASLNDIDINNQGEIVIGSRFGQVFLTNSSLSQATSFQVGGPWGDNVHVAFANALTPVPEPTSYALMVAGLALLGGLKAKRKNKAA